jgi:hypothetical protein
MEINMIKGMDHPDYVHEGEMPYVIDTADLTEDDNEKCALCPLIHILIGAAFGAALFLLGRWTA